jgi:ABC-type nitrate/sulfonate/bicarbonate transport system substrate-binding protein
MNRWIGAVTASFVLMLATASPIAAQDTTAQAYPLRVAQQPQRWSLAWYLAREKGWWKALGIEPTMSMFASGAPEVAAGASGSWDVGGAGDIPAVLGAARYGLLTIGIADEEPAINAIMAGKDMAERYTRDPSLIKGKTIPVATNSTGHWAASTCLEKKFGLKPDEYRFLNLSAPEINAVLTSGQYDISMVWSPNTYILASTIGAKVICTGKDVALPITSNLLAMPSFADQHPEIVAKFLAIYLRSAAWERAHPQQTIEYLSALYKSVGVNISREHLSQELQDRPTFTLAEQLKMFLPGLDGTSKVAQWSDQVAEFMKSAQIIKRAPDAKKYVTGKYLLMIENDRQLKAFAENSQD